MTFFADNQFYHEETKRLLISVSQLFSGITIEKLDGAGHKIESYKIPVDFGPKNKWISLIRERPDVTKQQVQITMPRISFEAAGFRYAPERKLGTNGTYAISDTPKGRVKIFNPVPYDVNIKLHVLTKDNNDALQVMEQIVPYFQPLLNINFDLLPEFNICKDIPIVKSPEIEVEDNYGTGVDEQRIVINTFDLTAQMYFFGKTTQPNKGIIKQVDVNYKFTKGNAAPLINRFAVNPKSANKSDPHSVDVLWK